MTDPLRAGAETFAVARATSLAHAFRWIAARRTRLPRTNIPRLIEFVVATFGLTLTERQWLTWSLEPDATAARWLPWGGIGNRIRADSDGA